MNTYVEKRSSTSQQIEDKRINNNLNLSPLSKGAELKERESFLKTVPAAYLHLLNSLLKIICLVK